MEKFRTVLETVKQLLLVRQLVLVAFTMTVFRRVSFVGRIGLLFIQGGLFQTAVTHFYRDSKHWQPPLAAGFFVRCF